MCDLPLCRDYSEAEKFGDDTEYYLEKHGISQLFSSLLKKLIIHQPKDALNFLIHSLEQNNKNLRILSLMPPDGPSNIHAQKLIQRIVKEKNTVHIKMNQIIQDEISAFSELGMQAKACMEQGIRVPPAIFLPLFFSRINKTDCLEQGWLLEGFPITKQEGHAMAEMGILATHCLNFLPNAAQGGEGGVVPSSPYDAATNAAAAAAVHQANVVNISEAKSENVSNNSVISKEWADYRLHHHSLLSLFYKIIHHIDPSIPLDQSLLSSLQFLSKESIDFAPHRRPLRMFLLGKRGTEKKKWAIKLAAHYGAVPLSLIELLSSSSIMIPSSSSFHSKGKLINISSIDENAIYSIITERLLQSDCRSKGFLLTFPPSIPSSIIKRLVNQFNIQPNRVVQLVIPDELSVKTVSGRRIDPLTDYEYSIPLSSSSSSNDSSMNDAIVKRLKQLPWNMNDCVKKDNNHWTEKEGGAEKLVKELYKGCYKEIEISSVYSSSSPSKGEQAVWEELTEFIQAPLSVSLYSSS